jgi:hypothetical protein
VVIPTNLYRYIFSFLQLSCSCRCLLHILDVHAVRVCYINEIAVGCCEESASKPTIVIHRTAEEYRIIRRIRMYLAVYRLGSARICSCILLIARERLYNLLPCVVPLQLPCSHANSHANGKNFRYSTQVT